MIQKLRMTDAIEGFLAYRKAEQRSPATTRQDRMVLRRLLLVTGDVYVSGLREQHITSYLTVAAASRDARSLHIDHATLSVFCGWLVRNRYLHSLDNPMIGRRSPRAMPQERQRIPMKDFGRLLEAAAEEHPRDRMVVALGLYLFLRGGEIADLRIGDVLPRLDSGEISVRIFKTKQIDLMPVCTELDQELRRWLTVYTELAGPLHPDWYLVPAKVQQSMEYDPVSRRLVRVTGESRVALKPATKIGKIEKVVQRALEKIGVPITDGDGNTLREGMHTLRRSGARALFDTQRDLGYDGAIRHVQAMLHHANMAMTEHYLGLTLDRVKRNELTRGQPMFNQPDHNVVPIREVSSGRGPSSGV